MRDAISYAQILIAALLIVVILLQSKGSSFSGAMGGDTGSIYRTRRGVEKRLFDFTIGLAAAFLLISVLAGVYY